MNQSDIVLALQPVVDLFGSLSIDYYIGGSIASSVHGIARATLDIDIVADIDLQSVPEMVRSLKKEYYISGEAIRRAIAEKASFNLIHLATMVKIDVFIQKKDPYYRQVSKRVIVENLQEQGTHGYYFVSAEDIIIQKLLWYQLGNQLSDRQFSDVIGVMKVQDKLLDLSYIRKWAIELNVLDLLEAALIEKDK